MLDSCSYGIKLRDRTHERRSLLTAVRSDRGPNIHLHLLGQSRRIAMNWLTLGPRLALRSAGKFSRRMPIYHSSSVIKVCFVMGCYVRSKADLFDGRPTSAAPPVRWLI